MQKLAYATQLDKLADGVEAQLKALSKGIE
jgi:hypothetical protein